MLPTNKRIVRQAEVLARTGLRPTALKDAIIRGEFPRAIHMTDHGRAMGWLEAELDAWLTARIVARDERPTAARQLPPAHVQAMKKGRAKARQARATRAGSTLVWANAEEARRRRRNGLFMLRGL